MRSPSTPPPDTEAVWQRFGADLRGWVARRVATADVDDVLQEAFLRIHRGLPGLADGERLAGWVHRVAASAVVDHARRRGSAARHLPSRPLDDEPEADREPHDDVPRLVASWLRPLLLTLPDDLREALELVELQGMSQQAFAGHAGLSPSGARSRVQRARAALRRQLETCCAFQLDRRGLPVDWRPRAPGECEACTPGDGEGGAGGSDAPGHQTPCPPARGPTPGC